MVARSAFTPEDISQLIEAGLQAESHPRHFKVADKALESRLLSFRPALLKILSELGLGDSEGDLKREFYKAVICTDISEKENSEDYVGQSPIRARAIPHRPAEENVQVALDRIAQQITLSLVSSQVVGFDQMNNAKRGISAALNAHLRKNLENVAKRKIFHLGDELWISMREIQAAFIDAKKQTKKEVEPISEEESIVYALYKLGALPEAEIRKRTRLKEGRDDCYPLRIEDRDTSELNNEIQESMIWARTFGQSIVKGAQGLITEYAIAGALDGRSFDLPDVNQDLRNKSLFQMLDHLFSPGGNPRNYNDAQIFLNLFLAHWTYQRFEGKINSTQVKTMCDKIIVGIFESEKEETAVKGIRPVFKYAQGTFTPVEGVEPLQDLRTIKVNGRTYPIFLDELGGKEKDPAIVKMFKPNRKTRANDITDLYRTKFVPWGYTAKKIREDEIVQMDLISILEAIAERLDLKRRPDLDNNDRCMEKLLPGQFCLTIEVEGRFPKIVLNAKLANGEPLEIQIEPFDTYCFEQTPGTGIDHDKLEEARKIDITRLLVPKSVSEVTHDVAEWRLAEIKEARDATIQAMNTEEIQGYFERRPFFKFLS